MIWGGSGNRGKAGFVAALCLLLFALALPAGAAAKSVAHTSIIGGQTGSLAEYPSLTFIEAREGKHGFSCTGTVVAPRIVLTAAHCVEDIERGTLTPAADYLVATGIDNPSTAPAPSIFKIAETHVFPGFDPGSLRGDAAILVLAAPTSTPPIALAGAADSGLYAGGTAVGLAGWGLTAPNAKDIPAQFRSTTVTEQTAQFCRKHTKSFNPEYSASIQLCTQQLPQKSSGGCFGDSGGPGIAHRADGSLVQIGVISLGAPECSTKMPNVLTRVDMISGWIGEWIAATETGGPRPAGAKTLPQMSKLTGEEFAVYTLIRAFGKRFENASEVFGQCRRGSKTQYRCEIAWVRGKTIYASLVTSNYLLRAETVAWKSSYKAEWASLKCIQGPHPNRCTIHRRHG
jgi:secreted trypsin-like serine protease